MTKNVFFSVKRLIILVITISFCWQLTAQIELDPTSSQSLIEDRMDYKICRNAKKYGGLSLSSQGGLTDIMLDKVREKTYRFRAKKELTMEMGREYMVKLVLDTLKIFNEEKLYRKHLFEYPFQTKNLNLVIFSKFGRAENRNLPMITSVDFDFNNLCYTYLTKIYGKPQGLVDTNEPEYEEKEIEEGFRLALNKVKNSLSPEQIATAKSLGLLDGNLVDERTCAHQEYRREILTKELWNLFHKKQFYEGKINKHRLNQALEYQKISRLNKWEKDIIFPDEKSRALYQKKVEYLKGEKEWEN